MVHKLVMAAVAVFLGCTVPAWSLDYTTTHDRGPAITPDITRPTQPTPPQEKQRIVTFGDSITQGYRATAYSVYLQQLLDENNCNAVVINQGKGGESITSGVSRIAGVLDKYKPHFILIMEGANDVKYGLSPGALSANLGGMVDKARNAGAQPIVSSITPNTQSGSERKEIPQLYNPKIAEMASLKGIPFVDNYAALAGSSWSSYNIDGIHLSNSGARVVARQFFAALPCGGGSGGGGGGGGDGGGGGGGGCFIATAAFGSSIDPYVRILTQFRDEYLLQSEFGRSFVRMYYSYSPPAAEVIERHEFLKAIVRPLLLPLIGVAYLLLNGLVAPVAAALLLVVGYVIGYRRRTQENVVS